MPADWTILPFNQDKPVPEIESHLATATHLLTTISAIGGFDPVLAQHEAEVSRFTGWVGYVSATSVYPDQRDGFVDETVPAAPVTKRRGTAPRRARLAASLRGRDFACGRHLWARTKRHSVLLLDGMARIIEKEGQKSNRIHLSDITSIITAAMAKPRPGRITNLCDHEPAAQGDVVRYAASLLQVPPPEPIAFEDADLTPMARSFYVSNRQLRSVIVGPELGVTLQYPTYREGLRALLESEVKATKP